MIKLKSGMVIPWTARSSACFVDTKFHRISGNAIKVYLKQFLYFLVYYLYGPRTSRSKQYFFFEHTYKHTLTTLKAVLIPSFLEKKSVFCIEYETLNINLITLNLPILNKIVRKSLYSNKIKDLRLIKIKRRKNIKITF